MLVSGLAAGLRRLAAMRILARSPLVAAKNQ
jgi:hypothetical protein